MKMMKKLLVVAAAALVAVSSAFAAPKSAVARTSTATDLTGYWNANDVRIACDEIVEKAVANKRIASFFDQNGRAPRVTVGAFKNQSQERIDTSIVVDKFQEAIMDDGTMEFYAGGAEREALRAEKRDMQSGYVSDDTVVSMTEEVGAEFMLSGAVKCMVQDNGKYMVRTYIVNAQLTDIRTNAIIWKGSCNDINKEFKKQKVKY